MDLRYCLQVLRKRWLSALLIVELFLGVGFALTLVTAPEYQSHTQLFVANPTAPADEAGDVYKDSQFSRERVLSYVELLRGARVAAGAGARAGLSLPADELRAKLSAETVAQTVLIRVSARDRDPRTAQRLASGAAAELVELVNELEGLPRDMRVAVYEPADLPQEPASPRLERNLGLGLALGVIAAVSICMLRESLDMSVNGDQLAGAGVLEIIPAERAEDATGDTSADAFRRLAATLRFGLGSQELRSLVVTAASIGESAFDTAAALAEALAETGLQIALVEADLQRPLAAARLGLTGTSGLSDTLGGQAEAGAGLQQWHDGVWLLHAGSRVESSVGLLSPRRLTPVLRELSEQFDLVILSAPPMLPAVDTSLIVAQVDAALLVVRPGRTGAAQLDRAVEAVHKVDGRLLGTVLVPSPGAPATSTAHRRVPQPRTDPGSGGSPTAAQEQAGPAEGSWGV